MEEIIAVYVVQAWIDGYEYWSNTAEPTTGMFAMPVSHYGTEDEGRSRLEFLRAASPVAKYRLVRVVTATETIA